MDIHISNDAAEWYKEEYDLENNASLRFFVRYGGVGGNIPGFSLGVNLEAPEEIHSSIKVNDILFYIEESDAWYFDHKDLFIQLNEELQEPQFSYQ